MRRLGRARVAVIAAEALSLVESRLFAALAPGEADPARRAAAAATLAAAWWRGEAAAAAQVEALLGPGRLSRAAVAGRAIDVKLPVLIGLEGLMRAAGRGRDDALRVFMLLREALAAPGALPAPEPAAGSDAGEV
ncbi:hypothetical protein [Alsobacter sp. SYSU BS001988]